MKKQFVFDETLIQQNSIKELSFFINRSTKAFALLVNFINCLNAFINKNFLVKFYTVSFQFDRS